MLTRDNHKARTGQRAQKLPEEQGRRTIQEFSIDCPCQNPFCFNLVPESSNLAWSTRATWHYHAKFPNSRPI